MNADFTYLSLILLFSLPVLSILLIRRRKVLWRERATLVSVTVFGILFQTITESIALAWGAWAFSGNGVVGIWLNGFPIEEIVLAVLFPLTLASVTVVLLDWRGRGKHRWLVG